MKTSAWALAAAGLLLGLLSILQLRAAGRGLVIHDELSASPPLTWMAPSGPAPNGRPVVLIGHGFAGSRLLMYGFGLTLAHAGYEVVLWDFAGHGANPQPLPASRDAANLVADAEAALAEARLQGLDTAGKEAILGHSMGSGAALAFGQIYPETAATIAVSPVGAEVTRELPHNLLLMAGGLEGSFLSNARFLLQQAGGAGGDPSAGTARQLVVVPGIEHISILFSPTAHAAARGWLEATFGPQPGAVSYTDRRMPWNGLGLAGALLFFGALAPLARPSKEDGHGQENRWRPALWRRLGALLAGGLGATLLLWLLGEIGLDLGGLLGLQVGGYLPLWFGVAGLLALLLLGDRPRFPSARAWLGGLLAFAGLWLGFGLLGQMVWLQWLLIPQRLLLWPVVTLLALPWFLAVAQALLPASRLGWAVVWLGHSALLVGFVYLALSLTPELGFLVIILPMFPVMLGLHVLAAAPQRARWAYALSGAMFLGWTLVAVFPLQ